MTNPIPQPDPIPVWDGHRGDGDLVVHVAGCADDAGLEVAKQGTHDSVIRGAGARRAGPVTWVIYGPSTDTDVEDGILLCTQHGLPLEQGLLDYLRGGPGRTLIVALVATDRVTLIGPTRRERRRR